MLFKMMIPVKAATGIDSEETFECIVSWRTTFSELMNQVSRDPRLQVFCEEWLGFKYSDKVTRFTYVHILTYYLSFLFNFLLIYVSLL